MIRTATTLTLLLTMTCAAAVAGQARPDFSGTWVEDESLRKTTYQAEPGAKAVALPSRPVTIKQTADSIDIEHAPPAPGWNALRHVYNLAGKQSVNHNGANTQTTTSRWDGTRLVTEGTSFSETSQGEFTWKYQEMRWLDGKGRMIIETRTTDQSGKTHVVTMTYAKK
jgi:hypothetical protein